jgi:hypothetical protein
MARDLSQHTMVKSSSLVLLSLVLLAGCGGGSGNGSTTPPPPKGSQTPPTINVPVAQLSADTFTNSDSQHATEVEPSALGNGSTIVSAFQVGRIANGGSADIGFATSTNGGASWSKGYLPGITTNFNAGAFRAASDPVVAYDDAHSTWLIASLAFNTTAKILVSRSFDGNTWSNPVTVSATNDADKSWTTCDNTPASPFYGHCYTAWDDPSLGGRVFVSTSTDGGVTWQPAASPANNSAGIGVQPVIQPNGNVIIPVANNVSNQPITAMLAFRSTDGGATWSTTVTAAPVVDHQVAGSLRTDPLPTAQVDASGRVYLIWQDCSFRASCASNDLVMSTSADGLVWTAPVRIPIDATTSSADYFIPGLAVEPGTGGATAHLALTYYFYPTANCAASTCSLSVGFISSSDGGNSWTAPTTLVSGMYLTSLASTNQGPMVGDYIATAFSNGRAFPVFALAKLPSGTTFDEAIYTSVSGLNRSEAVHAHVSHTEQPITSRSDHEARKSIDLEGRYPTAPHE